MIRYFSPEGDEITYAQARQISKDAYTVMGATLSTGERLELKRESMFMPGEKNRFYVQRTEFQVDRFGRMKPHNVRKNGYREYAWAVKAFDNICEEFGAHTAVTNSYLDRICLIETGLEERAILQPADEFDNDSVAGVLSEEEQLLLIVDSHSGNYASVF